MMGQVVVEDSQHGVFGDPRFCMTIDHSHNKIYIIELANTSDRSAEVFVEYESKDKL